MSAIIINSPRFIVPILAESHRYWRVRLVGAYDTYWGLCEIEMASSLGGANDATTGQAIYGDQRGGYPAINAFDGIKTGSNGWSPSTTSNVGDRWIGQDFNTPYALTELRMWARDDGYENLQAPGKFVVEHSDDNISWTNFWTFDREPPWGLGETRTYTATQDPVSATAATHWRVWCGYTDNSSYCHIAELKMATSYGGANIATTGAAIAGAARSGFPATEAFDGIVSGNNSWGYQSSGGLTNRWVGQNFSSAQLINEIKMTGRADSFSNQTPRAFALQKSLDSGVSWETVWVETGIAAWSAALERTFQVS